MLRTATAPAVMLAFGLLGLTLQPAINGAALAAPSAADATPAAAHAGDPSAEGNAAGDLLGKRVWYQGGTLHLSTLNEWSDASARNRLATAGDWTARMFSPRKLYRMGLGGIRTHAEALVACVDGVADTGANGGQRSSKVAMACHLTLLSR